MQSQSRWLYAVQCVLDGKNSSGRALDRARRLFGKYFYNFIFALFDRNRTFAAAAATSKEKEKNKLFPFKIDFIKSFCKNTFYAVRGEHYR